MCSFMILVQKYSKIQKKMQYLIFFLSQPKIYNFFFLQTIQTIAETDKYNLDSI